MTNMTKPVPTNTVAPCCGGGVSRIDLSDATALGVQLSAIADPVRIQMLSIIASSASGEVCDCDFVEPIGKSQPTISHHLKVLYKAGLVAGNKRGRWIWYRLSPGSIDGVISSLKSAIADSPS